MIFLLMRLAFIAYSSGVCVILLLALARLLFCWRGWKRTPPAFFREVALSLVWPLRVVLAKSRAKFWKQLTEGLA